MPTTDTPLALTQRLRSSRPLVLAAAGIGLATVLAGCASGTGDDGSTGSDGSNGTDSVDSEGTTTSGDYADGTYEADGSYQSPNGAETISVEITLEDNIVTDVTVTPQADGGNSEKFQTQFAGGIADEVVGENIDSLEVSRVAGSSLTSGGFNEAIDEIKSEAAA